MATETKTVESKVTQENIDLDSLFDGAAGAESVTVPEDSKPKSVFSKPTQEADFSFADPEGQVEEETETEVETEANAEETTETETKSEAKESAEEVFDALDILEDEEVEEEKKETRGRKKISGISDVFNKLIKDDKIVPFDDDKPLEDYTAKDWEELIEANLEEKANQVRRETPKQFFESLPQVLRS